MNSPQGGAAARYAAAIFDMDGLIFDTETLARQVWDAALAKFGYRLTDEIYRTLIGRDMRWRERLLIEHFGPELPFEAAKQLRMQLGDDREIAEGLPLKPGVRELVLTLHQRRVPMIIATGTERPRALRRLQQAGLAECFQGIVSSGDVAHGKPAPDIYIEAAAQLGLPASRCVAFEDSCAGVSSAAAAGACVVMVPDLEAPDPVCDLPAHILPSLESALELIPHWFGGER